jgi:hypothetical protein
VSELLASVEPGPLPFPAGEPSREALCPAGTPPGGLAYLGARATVRCWMVSCPECLAGWLAVLPSGSPFGYRPAVSLGCSRGCPPDLVEWAWHWRLGNLAELRRLGGPPEQVVGAEPQAGFAAAPVHSGVRFTGAPVDAARLAEAMRRSHAAQRVWTGAWYARRPDQARLQLCRGLVRAGVREPDALRAALVAYERRQGRDPALSLPETIAAAAIGAAISGRRA